MKLRRLPNGDLEITTRKGNTYRAVDLHDGYFNVWDEQRHEVIIKIQYLDELFETVAYREFSMN
jgi:hypothetical protein